MELKNKELNNIYAVIVLYNDDLKSSQTYQSFISNSGNLKFRGVIYDNSAIKQDVDGKDKLGDFEYCHDPSNKGLATAYNFALKKAEENNCEWLFLLDQDTYFTEQYFEELLKLNNMDKLDNDVVAIIPVIKSYSDKKTYISPAKIYFGTFLPMNTLHCGKMVEKISGLNSGTIINCDFMKSIGTFNLDYPLDMLDHWYFREIYRNSKSVYLLESEIYQNLSVFGNLEKTMTLNRYQKLLKMESQFFKSDNVFQYIMYKLRLVFRVRKQMRFNNKEYYKSSLKEIFSL